MNRTLTVTTILNPPYMMIKESPNVLQKNNQYEGFVPDMVEILSSILHFNYTLRVGNARVIYLNKKGNTIFFLSC